VLSATNPGVFDAVSIAAARSWTYRPAMKNGKPVAAAVKIPITFAMDNTEDTNEVAPLMMAAALLVGCASQDRLTTVDTRSENVGHQRLQPRRAAAVDRCRCIRWVRPKATGCRSCTRHRTRRLAIVTRARNWRRPRSACRWWLMPGRR
jgi:hypothetical protein